MIYLDTSVIAALYWREALSDAIEQLLLNETEVGLSQLVEVERAEYSLTICQSLELPDKLL
ncbi:MAG: hypothetical protein V7L22_06315 [Nostoc sp.]|uniref:hypothetical protein n=1 Tax=Nostoc sp. TaxID=1180 RepID=UPI002FF5B4E7